MIRKCVKVEILLFLVPLVVSLNFSYALPHTSKKLNAAIINTVDQSQAKLNHIYNNATQLGEARIILPKLDNNGTSLEHVGQELEIKIVDLFGGFTNFEGLGGWKSDDSGILHHEPVWIYDIALSDSIANHGKLFEMALWLRDEAHQESVYLRLPNGEVNFV